MRINPKYPLARIRRYMSSRRWVAHRAELVALGVREKRIDDLVRSQRLTPVLPGVYAFGRDIETKEAAYRAALLAAGPGSVLSGRSACELWGLVASPAGIPRRITVASPRQKAVTVSSRSKALAQTRVRVTHRSLDPDELRRRHGLDVTSPARSLIDFAAEATPRQLRFAFLEACRLGLFNRRDVAYCYRRIVGRRGARRLRPLLALWQPELGRIRSVLEGTFLLAWIAYGGAMPKVNAKVFGYEVDAYWPDHGLVVELDGRTYHRGPVSRARDAEKDRYLRSRGLTVLRFDTDAVNKAINRVVMEVANHLAPSQSRRGVDYPA